MAKGVYCLVSHMKKKRLPPEPPPETQRHCPYCNRGEAQIRAGHNRSGTTRYRCGSCQRHYTPTPRTHGYPDELRQRAREAHAAGVPLRRIARLLEVNHQTVANWVRQEQAPKSPLPERLQEELPALKSRATIEDVARRAGVAASTVSNYLNNKGRMSAATRERLRAAIDALHFSPNALVRAIRVRRTRILGVLIFDLERMDARADHALTIPLLAGIYAAADAAGYDVLLYTGWPKRPERHSGMDFLSGHVDGLLWAVPGIDTPALERIAAAGLPVVAMLSRHVPANIGYVNGENIQATEELVGHLAERGHRRIAFAGPVRRSSNYEDRRAGYRLGLERVGLAYDPALEPSLPDDRDITHACQRLFESWRTLTEPPTAVIAVTDAWAEAIGAAAQQQGLRVPEDLAITGFDDVAAATTICGGLTTIHQPFRAVGEQAVGVLLKRIEGAPVEASRIQLPLRLVVRTSSG